MNFSHFNAGFLIVSQNYESNFLVDAFSMNSYEIKSEEHGNFVPTPFGVSLTDRRLVQIMKKKAG